jgi:carbon catabolite-derepressing protein kinase
MSVTSEEEGIYSPSKLGEYTVIQEIGEGTFGKVKSKQSVDPTASRPSPSNSPEAVHTITGHEVAMKYISKQVINATKTKTRVQREVEYMRMLRHAHIIKLYVLTTLHLISETPTPYLGTK